MLWGQLQGIRGWLHSYRHTAPVVAVTIYAIALIKVVGL